MFAIFVCSYLFCILLLLASLKLFNIFIYISNAALAPCVDVVNVVVYRNGRHSSSPLTVVEAVIATAAADAGLSTSYGFITLLIKCHKIKSNFAVGKAFAFPFSPSKTR